MNNDEPWRLHLVVNFITTSSLLISKVYHYLDVCFWSVFYILCTWVLMTKTSRKVTFFKAKLSLWPWRWTYTRGDGWTPQGDTWWIKQTGFFFWLNLNEVIWPWRPNNSVWTTAPKQHEFLWVNKRRAEQMGRELSNNIILKVGFFSSLLSNVSLEKGRKLQRFHQSSHIWAVVHSPFVSHFHSRVSLRHRLWGRVD